MRAHVLHALRSAAARTPLAAAVFLNALVLAAFVLAWGDGRGIPQYARVPFYLQARAVELFLLALLLPWAAVRVSPAERGRELAMLAADTAVRPSRIAAARISAVFVITTVIAFGAMPVLLIAARMSGVSVAAAIRGALAAVPVAAIATVSGAGAAVLLRSRVAAWVAASCSTMLIGAAVLAWAPSMASAAATLAGIAVVSGAIVAARCDSACRYPEAVTA